MHIKLTRFQQIVGTIKSVLSKKVRLESVLKFYKLMAIPTLFYGLEV